MRGVFRTLLRPLLLLVAVLLAAITASPAAGQSRVGAVGDPQDRECRDDISGGRNCEPFDIEEVRASYDAAGSVTLAVRFYSALPAANSFDTADLDLSLSTGSASRCFATEKGDLNLSATLPPDSSYPGYESMWLTDYDGRIPFTGAVTPDRRGATFTASHGALANRPYNCAGSAEISVGGGAGCNEFGCHGAWSSTYDEAPSFGISSSVPSPQRLPALSTARAKHYIRVALRREFGSSYRVGRKKRITSCGHASQVRMTCRVAWTAGSRSFRGRATIWYTRDADGSVVWNYAWTIRRVDSDCRARSSRACTKTFRVR